MLQHQILLKGLNSKTEKNVIWGPCMFYCICCYISVKRTILVFWVCSHCFWSLFMPSECNLGASRSTITTGPETNRVGTEPENPDGGERSWCVATQGAE